MARTRAYRRNQRGRARQRAAYIVDRIWRFSDNRFHNSDHDMWRARLICQLMTDRKPCSCEGCGNQRRWYGPTLQEYRFDIRLDPRYDSLELEDSHVEDPNSDPSTDS